MEIAALVISGISMIVAIASYLRSEKSQHLQDRVNEIELKLKEYELAEKEQQKAACVEARIVHTSNRQYKIKIWNSGNAIANNVSASWDGKIILYDQEKMPFEFLEPQKSFELSVSTYMGSPRKMLITTTWTDDNGEEQKKEQWCDL